MAAICAAESQAEIAVLGGMPADFGVLPRRHDRRRDRVDRHRRSVGVDRPGEARGAGVEVAGLILGPHFEAVASLGEAAVLLRRGAGGKGSGVEPAFERGDARAAVAAREVKEAALRPERSAGWAVIWVSGAVVSIVQVKLAGLGVGVAGLSLARTSKLWEPSASAGCSCFGEVQAASGSGVEPAFEGGDAGAAVAAREAEARRRSGPRVRRTGGDLGVGGGGVDGPGEARRAGVGVAGLILGPDFEAVGAVGERGCIPSARCRRPSAAGVEPAFEEATPEPPSLPEKLKEAPALLVGLAGWARVSCGVGGGGVDRPGEARRAGVEVAGLILGPNFEAVGAVGEAGCIASARCRRPRLPRVAPAFEGGDARAAVAAREGERGVGGVELLSRVAGDLGIGRGVSIVQVKLAGVGSTLPAWSIARTSKLWAPSARAG